ncbi:MAG: alanine dehydrogenase [Thermoprotei archaeon]|nr:MAG: alanine dehydrogenase [Thermoprotei archaeon]
MGDGVKTLLLTAREVRELISMEDVIKVVEEAFREKGLKRVQMPPKVYLFFRKYGGDLRAMPAYLETMDAAGVKVVNVHPNNPDKYGLPTVMATIVLIDPRTGFPLAIMDGTYITNLRTGAAGAIASKYLARGDSKVLGIIGAGRQGRALLKAHLVAMKNLERVLVYDIKREAIERFVKEFRSELGSVEIVVCNSAREVVENSDIVCTATPSTKPIVMREWVRRGTHFNCIGADAPGKQELDPEILKMAKVVVDDIEQALHSGELNVPYRLGIVGREVVYAELGEVVAGLKPGRVSRYEVTVFTSTGLAIQDVAVAKLVYERARERGLGTEVSLVLHD